MLNVQSLNTYRISHVPNPSPPAVSVFRASKLELILGTFKHVSQGSLPLLSRPSVLGNPLGPCLFLAHKIGPFYAPAYSKNSGRALSVTPVRPVRLSVRPSVRPSVRLSVRMSHFRVMSITPKSYGIYSWNFTGAYITIRRCVMNKEDNSCIFLFLNYFPLTRFRIVNRVRAITPKPYGIYSWNFTSACIILIRCVMNKEDNSYIFCFWIIFSCLSCI